jgi:hypothetical protein
MSTDFMFVISQSSPLEKFRNLYFHSFFIPTKLCKCDFERAVIAAAFPKSRNPECKQSRYEKEFLELKKWRKTSKSI